MKRRVGCVSVARSDYGIYTPVFDAIAAHPDLELGVVAAAAHLSPDFGFTVQLIEQAGYPVVERVEMLLAGDSPGSIARSSGIGTTGFATAFDRQAFDIIVLLGDRFEMMAAAVAAVPFLTPLAHIHGGEETTGAIDNQYRHAITKLSHQHFVSTDLHAQRVIQMGENPARVRVVGAPTIDRLLSRKFRSRQEVSEALGRQLPESFLVGTFHPVTTDFASAYDQTQVFLQACRDVGVPLLLTMPNADTGGREVRRAISDVQPGDWLWTYENLGAELYADVMHHAAAMVGNSSSGIIEAASLHLPVVNIGSRQQGRVRSRNVLDVACEPKAITTALRQALSPTFRETCRTIKNVYGDGHAGRAIAKCLAEISLDSSAILKPFHDLNVQ